MPNTELRRGTEDVGIEPLLWNYSIDDGNVTVSLREPTPLHYLLRRIFGRYFYPND